MPRKKKDLREMNEEELLNYAIKEYKYTEEKAKAWLKGWKQVGSK